MVSTIPWYRLIPSFNEFMPPVVLLLSTHAVAACVRHEESQIAAGSGGAGVEAFYVTARKNDPNTFVFYEIYKSQAAQDFHLRQDLTKKFLATLKSADAADRVRGNLVELPLK